MAIDKFAFNPTNGFEDSSSFPDPGSEADTREQMMRLHYQTRDYINENVQPYVDAMEAITGQDVSDIVDAIRGTTKAFTLYAANWQSNNYQIDDDAITSPTSNQRLLVSNLTTAQYNALLAARLIDGGQTTGTLYLRAMGTVPSIDIPILIQFHGDASAA